MKPQKIPIKIRQIAEHIRKYNNFSCDCDVLLKELESGYVDIDGWMDTIKMRTIENPESEITINPFYTKP